MRLRRLSLEGYGNFRANALDLDDRPGMINVIVAPNGFGKSVLRRAVSELLFGIHPQTPMGFQFGYDRMRLISTAAFPDGEAMAFARRKGRSNTLTNHDGKPAHASLPSRLPREAERKRLERLFMLDSAALRDGGKALLQTDGDLADALLSSAGDLGSARTLAQDLAAKRDGWAPERKKSAPFYDAADDWTRATERLRTAVTRPAAVEEQERLRSGAIAAKDAANAEIAALRAELARLARVRTTRRHLQDLDEAAAWLGAHAGAPALPPVAGVRLEQAKTTLARAERDAAEVTRQHHLAAAELAALALDEAVLAEAAVIERLTATLTQTEASRSDIPKREAELSEARREVARLLRELSSPHGPEDAAAELRPAADIAAARGLIGQFAGLSAARLAAAKEAAAADERLAQAGDELAALPEAAETESLQAALADAALDGDAARQMQAASRAEAETAALLRAAADRVPGWHGEPAALAAMSVPAEATLARLDTALATARAAARAAEARRMEDAAALEAARARLMEMTRARPLPDLATLVAARAHRDRGWALVFARLNGEPRAAEEAAYAPGQPLPLAFERAMAAADAVADRRAEESTRLAAAAELQATIANHDAALLGSTEQDRLCREAVDRAHARWIAALAPIGLPGDASLAEARAFLSARERLLDAMAAHRAARDAAEALAVRQAALAAQLAAAMQTPPDTLPRLMLVGAQRIKAAERVEAQRQAHTRTQVGARRMVAEAAPALAQADAALAAWSGQWATVLTRLGRAANEPPDVTAAVLDRLGELPAQVKAAETAESRLADMRQQLGAFATACTAAATRLGDPGGEPEAVARRLGARLKAGRAVHAQRETLARQTAAALTRAQESAAVAARATAELEAAIAATGADTLGAAEGCVALAAERQTREAAHSGALARLREDGDGRDLATLRAEHDANPPDTVAAATADAEGRAQAAQDAALAAAADLERAEGALRSLAAGEDAGRAAADRQSAAARLSHVLEDALVQHLAATMLEHGLQAVEDMGSTNDRLQRIGQTFARLTNGAYSRLSPAGEDDKNKVFGRLLAYEAGGAEKHVGELSEGTRDQLYLALRLVAVEDHVQHAPPLPFVADDILQTFDDVRARAALEALVGLSQHVQVILLTHHPHLLQLAHGLPVHQPNWETL